MTTLESSVPPVTAPSPSVNGNKLSGEKPYLREPLDPKKVNWRREIDDKPVDLSNDKNAKEAMNDQMRKDFVNIIFRRYEEMSKYYSAPKPGEKKPPRQQLDNWSEWLMEEMAAECRVDKFPDGPQDQVVKYIRDNLDKIDIKDLHPDTRNAAYFLVVGTEMEMMAASAVSGRNVANVRGGIIDSARYAVQSIYDKFMTDDKVLNVIAFFDPTLSHPEFRQRWKNERIRSHITSYEPVSQAYDSAYMKVLDFAKLPEDQRRQELVKVEAVRAQFAYATTGVDVHNTLWDQINGIIKRDPDAEYISSLDPRQRLFVQKLEEVLHDDYGDVQFQALSIEKRTPALLQAASRAIAQEGKVHAKGILERTAKNEFSTRKVSQIRERLDHIEPAKSKKEEDALQKDKRVQEVIGGQNEWKVALKARDDKRREHSELKSKLTRQRDDLDMRRVNAVAQQAAAKPGSRDQREWDDRIVEFDKQIAELGTQIGAIPLSTVDIPEDIALEDKVSALLAKLKDFDDSTVATIADIITGPRDVEGPKLTKIIAFRDTQAKRQKEEADKETEKMKKVAAWRKSVGPEVLRVILEESNHVVAEFVNGVEPSEIEEWDEFADKLQLNQKFDDEYQVLTPNRLAKLLAMHLEISDIDPNRIKNFLTTGKAEDKEQFDKYWGQIMDRFWKLDSFGRGKIVLELYGDRFNALWKKADPSADVVKYKQRGATEELMPRQMESEEFFEVLDREGIHPGVNTIVDNVSNMVLVGKDGDVMVYEINELQGNRRELRKLAPLGIEKAGTDIRVTNPALERNDRRLIMAEFAARELRDKNPVGYKITVAGREITVAGPRAEDVLVTSGAEVSRLGAPIPLTRFIEFSDALDDEFQKQGGTRIVEHIYDRSKNLKTLTELKAQGIKDKVEIDNVPDSLTWASSKADHRYVVNLADRTGMSIKHEEYDATAKIWKDATDFTSGKTGNNITFADFIGLSPTEDPDALRGIVPASASELLLRMSPEQRKQLDFDPVAVDISVAGVTDEKVSIMIDEEGEIIAQNATGERWPLEQLLDRAVMSNDGTAQPFYHEFPAAMATANDKIAQENIKIQTEIGKEFLKKLYRKRQLQ